MSASDAIQQVSGFDVEYLCDVIFYWFDKSTKRKGILKEFAPSVTVHTIKL